MPALSNSVATVIMIALTPWVQPGTLMGIGMADAAAAAAAAAAPGSSSVDVQWHAPAQSPVNDLASAINGTGVYGFIFNSSVTPDSRYGTYNWCNMPHARSREYVKAADGYELRYVELMHRHHKRTPYSSNAFPVEPYHWDCNDARLRYYGQPSQGPDPAAVYRQGYISPVNPFVPAGWIGTCQFPQITAGGLQDSWQHGADLYDVYHNLLGFLPVRGGDVASLSPRVKYRVTNNLITSQVAGMVISGMWDTNDPLPLMVQADGIDSLEPQYSCPAASSLFSSIKSSSNPQWQLHLDAAAGLYCQLDDLSGVPPTDGGFHASFDHYYDNLSARQCHAKPLPCKLVDGRNSTYCVSQELADAVYRLGNWEYSQIYRDSPSSLAASAASLGVWVGELTTHLRDVVAGNSETIYFHNVAHDGSVSRLLSILQIDQMVWPGMGSEVIFELYRKTNKDGPQPTATATPIAPGCHHDNCLRHMIQNPASVSSLCQSSSPSAVATGPAAPSSWSSECPNASQLSSACSCLVSPTPTAATATSSAFPNQTASPATTGDYYMRVLFGGKVLKSSSPTLGLMDMVPVETFLAYMDGLVGKGASSVKANCLEKD